MLSQEDASILIRKTLELPDGFELRPDRKISSVPGWDSIGWLNVICAIEEASQKQVAIEALDDVHTLADLFSLVAKL
jgi:acyl carrier protein